MGQQDDACISVLLSRIRGEGSGPDADLPFDTREPSLELTTGQNRKECRNAYTHARSKNKESGRVRDTSFVDLKE